MKLINSLKQISFLKSVKRKIVLNNRKIANFLSVKWLKTLYFNFKMFKFKTARKLPVFFYGKVKFNSLKGEIVITAPIKRGMVKFGYNLEIIKKAIGVSELKIDGIFIINGAFHTGIDSIIIVQKGATLEIGENSHLGSRTRTVVTKKVTLGRYFRLSQESQILDSSFHYMLDTEKNEVKRFNGEIIINDYCWVGNRTTIMKNTITPRYTTVASNSLLNRDYTKEVPEKSVIGGVPARLLKKNMSRVYEAEKEAVIADFFNSHPNEQVYRVIKDLFL
jgi:acetyltransferase-like isoleucine patch superfamily enzyme